MTSTDLGELRDRASLLVSSLRARWPAALVVAGIDVGPALEQQLYVRLRDGLPTRAGPAGLIGRAGNAALPFVAAARSLVGTRPPAGDRGSILAVIRQPVHARLLEPVEAELRRRGGPPVHVIRVGPAARTAGPGRTLDAHLDRRAIVALLRTPLPPAGELGATWAPLVGSSGRPLASAVRSELRVLRIAAVGLQRAIEGLRPASVVTYDEVGRWGRLIAAAAQAAGIASVDLPHAEAVDEVAMRGMAFDVVAVFGPAAARRVAAAGVPAERIVEVGSPALDQLVARAARDGGPGGAGRRIVFASQYIGGAMTERVKARTLQAAIEATRPAAPAELVLVRHPVEDGRLLATAAAQASVPGGITLRVSSRGLHEELPGAWLLITGSSQSVIDATAVSVPALTVNCTDGPDLVSFAADGMALGATSGEEAGAQVASLLEPGVRERQVDRARRVLAERAGPLDGQAAARIAEILLRVSAAREPRG